MRIPARILVFCSILTWHTSVMRATALLLLQLAAASAQSCANTCFQGSCDYWDGGVWGTCAVLESTYSCDCSGCECDGCPQGTCGVDQPFDPATCLNAGDARCDPGANTEACAWDGGDCCATTCVGTLCGSRHGYDCRDPAHAATDEEAQAEQDRAYALSLRQDAARGDAALKWSFIQVAQQWRS